ncbi:DNA-binding protein [Klebsiella aerogenes]|uniref:H-NS family histone-like protein n=1 Tax=Klebsiella aerogenes TaxID=548 RepID=UPI00063CA8AA|nr:H-NS family nucleoid-associated regulatory protein [Klebsiella aerogenes]KLF28662.1 DNA-binding protein [Klebsiella aerogenes]
MTNSLVILTNIRSLRALARETEYDILQELYHKLSAVVLERRDEEAVAMKAKGERQARLEAIRAQMLAEGLDPHELMNISVTKPRTPRPAKYQYTSIDGINKTWTGQGKTPRVIAEAIKNGQTLADFLIQ